MYHGRYLPVEGTVSDGYVNMRLGVMEIHPGKKLAVREHKFGSVEPEILYCIDKMQETWDGKCEFVEEPNFEPLETKGSDPTNNLFQVSAITSKPKQAKVKKCDGCRDWCMYELPPHIMTGNR
jgi:hypothetical protein